MNELNMACFVTNLIVTASVGALLPIIPTLTRKSFLFGVGIPPEESGCAEAQAMKKRYIAVCLFGSAAILAANIAQFALAPDWTLVATLYFPLLFIAVQLAAFVPQHRAALRLKRERGWRVADIRFAETQSSHARGSLSGMPWAWYVISLIAVFADIAALLARYPSMPERIPTHYGFDMQPDAWADKSIGTVMFMPINNIVLIAVMWATGLIVERGKLQIDIQKPVPSFEQHRIYRRRLGHSIGFLTLGMALMLGSSDLPKIIDGFRLNFWLWLMLCIVPTAVVCAVAIGSGQGGCLIKTSGGKPDPARGNPETQGRAGRWDGGQTGEGRGRVRRDAESARQDAANDRSDDRLWALGLFYHNPDDPAVFVQNRFGTNFGLNYARRAAKIGVALFALAMAAFYVWFTLWWSAAVLG